MATACDRDPPDCTDITTLPSPQQEGMGEKLVFNLEGIARTLLVPLIARAYDNTLPVPILGDPYAEDVLQKIELDADAMPMSPFQKSSIALRTTNFDRWATTFLENNSNAAVLHLACGFYSRMQRVEWGEKVRWIDIDLPEVIELRRKVQPVSLPGRDYSLLGFDVLDPNWMHEIGDISGPVLVIMEGLLAYLPENDVRGLLRRVCESFSEGEMLFESVSSAALNWLNHPESLKAVSNMNVAFQSSIDDPPALEALHPHFKFIESVPVAQAPGTEKFPLLSRTLMYLTSWLPSGRDSARLLRFRFGEATNATAG